ncbi:hypothetical protein PVK06_019385 [Gossypium arboreum]|uniref:Aminotransferase-like plant mobile domain-containing protein n=1 Tax=Gossypium arboreum TaxID=29729 RepID=A0ABR0PK17_GOSAR|nr:hypothetical protein PVK06_019385 [Gossypium arboreum]
MASSLIHFNDNHISIAQSIMADGRVLERLIHNLSKCTNTKIHGYLQYTGFLHVYRMLMGCKLDLTLISVLVGKWRPEMHTFYLLCDECTITLNDVALQLSFLVKRTFARHFGGRCQKVSRWLDRYEMVGK